MQFRNGFTTWAAEEFFIPPPRSENPSWWETKFGDDSIEVFNRIVGDKCNRYWEPDYGDPLF